MVEFLNTAYPWIKSLHVISVIAWMAGMLYLPRLFVYHAEAEPGSEISETFKVMERRLLRAIMNPAMIASLLFGFWLIFIPGLIDWASWWIYAKVVLTAGMFLLHILFGLWRKDFEADNNVRSAKFYRIINEVPTALMVVIVILVVIKPG